MNYDAMTLIWCDCNGNELLRVHWKLYIHRHFQKKWHSWQLVILVDKNPRNYADVWHVIWITCLYNAGLPSACIIKRRRSEKIYYLLNRDDYSFWTNLNWLEQKYLKNIWYAILPFVLKNDGLEVDFTHCAHYNDVIMSAMASQISSLMIVYSTVYSGSDKRKHQSSASLTFVCGIHRWPVNSPHRWPVTRKVIHLMTSSW